MFIFKVPVLGCYPAISVWPGISLRRAMTARSAVALKPLLRGTVCLVAIAVMGCGLSGCVTSSRSGKATPPVSVAALSRHDAMDPLLAAPPPTTAGDSSGSHRVPLGALAPADSTGSQRVPLGALTPGSGVGPATVASAGNPAATSPPLLIVPKSTLPAMPAPSNAPPAAVAMAAPTPMPQAANPSVTTSEPVAASSPSAATTATMAPSAPVDSKYPAHVVKAGANAPPPAAPAIKSTTLPKLQLPTTTASTGAVAAKAPPRGIDNDETVVISSTTPVPIEKSREFIPALLSEAGTASAMSSTMPASTALGAVINQPMSAAEKNVAQRFEVLKRLLDEGLITPEEYTRHRNANIGALLPFTRDPAAVGLERPSADADAIVARLEALRRALEMRAISADQHASERAMILSALLPTTPDERTEAPPPPGNVIEGAAMVAHLQVFKGRGLITADEFDDERKAIDQYLRTGSFTPPAAVADAKAAKSEKDMKKAESDSAKAAETAGGGSSDVGEITGPVLHLASFRTEDAAKRGWQEALGQNKAILASYHQIIRKVDLGEGKGVFFRLMAGPFASLSDAESTCIKLKANNQFCRASADGS